MINFRYSFNADDVSRTFRVLRQLDPELVKTFRREMRTDLKPAAQAMAAKYPTAPYLSGLAPYGSVKSGRGGFTRVRYNREKSSITVRNNWVWSKVVGKVSITPGKSRKGVGRNSLVALRMNYSGAIPWVTDMARDEGSNLSPQGKALVRNINARFPQWERGGRIFYKEFMNQRKNVYANAEKIMVKFLNEVQRKI